MEKAHVGFSSFVRCLSNGIVAVLLLVTGLTLIDTKVEEKENKVKKLQLTVLLRGLQHELSLGMRAI